MFKRRRKLLEPRNWAEFINKEREVNLLRDTFRAARGRRELPGHILLFGPPGCGKTTLGKLLCGDSIWPSKHVAGPAMEPEVLIYLFRKFRRGVLLIDEIHGLKRPLQEMLLPVMSEGRFFFGDTSIEVDLCLIGTTTSRGLLLAPLRDRFALEVYIAPYNTKEIRLIVTQAAEWLGTELTFPGGVEISRWARGVPRLALRILRRGRDIAGRGAIDLIHIKQAIKDLGFDENGLLPEEREYVETLKRFGGRTGLANLMAAMQQNGESIRLIEAHLLRTGLIEITGRGRHLTEKGERVV